MSSATTTTTTSSEAQMAAAKIVSFGGDASPLGLRLVVKNTFLTLEDPHEGSRTVTRRATRRNKTTPAFGYDPSSSSSSSSDESEDISTNTSSDGGRVQDSSRSASPRRTDSPLAPAAPSGAPGSEGGAAAAAVAAARPGSEVLGRVWALSCTGSGCRLVQDALETSPAAVRAEIAQELRGHVAEAVHSPFGNHVLQKCIMRLRPEVLVFILDELLAAGICNVARHKFGCRVLQRVFEHCNLAQARPLVDAAIHHFSSISRHSFGNYVAQCLFERYPSGGVRDRIVDRMAQDIEVLCCHEFASPVVARCLSVGNADQKLILIRSILSVSGLLPRLATSRLGHHAALQLLHSCRPHERAWAEQELLANSAELRASRLGARVLAALEGRGGRRQ